MSDNRIDIFETILKDDLRIPLTDKEKEALTKVDDDIKQQIYEIVNNPAFLDEIISSTNTIISKAYNLSEEDQQYIIQKCEERIRRLKYPNLTVNSCDSITSK